MSSLCEDCILQGRCEGCAEVDGDWSDSDLYWDDIEVDIMDVW